VPDLRHIEERTATTPIMGSILALFSDGKKLKRAHASALADISERSFRANVERLNELGYPIISEGDGFFYATTIEQIRKSKTRLEATRDSLNKRIIAHDKMEAEFSRLQDGVKQLKLL
jgi:hypothetical protein